MIKASDIGLEKADYTKDVFAEYHKANEKFWQIVKEKQEEKRFNELNDAGIHTVQELIALMRYKGVNIKAHINPDIFFEVAEVLERQQKELQEYNQKAQISCSDIKLTYDQIFSEEDL